MNRTLLDETIVEDNFAVAQVALYLFAILQCVVALMTATGAVPLGIAAGASHFLRLSVIANSVVNILCFAVGYCLLARSLTRCTRLVWRIGFGIFLLNMALASLGIAANPNLFSVLTLCLSAAGALSVWRGRRAVRECTIGSVRTDIRSGQLHPEKNEFSVDESMTN
jgi:hypothetical protein